jgi:hypothetical protein
MTPLRNRMIEDLQVSWLTVETLRYATVLGLPSDTILATDLAPRIRY